MKHGGRGAKATFFRKQLVQAPPGARSFSFLEKIEQPLADREKTESCAGKENCPNKRLLSQRREGACLEVADFRDELIERLPFLFACPTQQAKSAQIVEGSFTQLFGSAPEQDGAAECPGGSDCRD
jgi:hypothetical protein